MANVLANGLQVRSGRRLTSEQVEIYASRVCQTEGQQAEHQRHSVHSGWRKVSTIVGESEKGKPPGN